MRSHSRSALEGSGGMVNDASYEQLRKEVAARAPSPVTESSCRNGRLLTVRCAWRKVGGVSYRQSSDQELICDPPPTCCLPPPSRLWVAPPMRRSHAAPTSRTMT